MRILLQQKDTGLYLENSGVWSPSSREAKDFVSSTAAIEFCVTHRIHKGVHLVLKFDEHKYDIVLPLQPATLPEVEPVDSRRTL